MYRSRATDFLFYVKSLRRFRSVPTSPRKKRTDRENGLALGRQWSQHRFSRRNADEILQILQNPPVAAMSARHDPELQRALARDGLIGLDALLTALPAGESIACAYVGALVRLIVQAAEIGAAA
jgi:hypothetical protein